MLATLAEMHGTASMGESATAVRVEVEGEGPFTVLGVEDRLAQVLQNLVSNARSFSPPGGTITLGLRREGTAIMVGVHDDGPGVPAGMEEAIFRRFYTDRPEGEPFGAHSGLGLSISAPDRRGPRRPAELRQPARRCGRHRRRKFPTGASRRGLC